jgi:VIT1/CCC1 family predicted Fe2+/Mn2+ transporter
VEPPRPGPVARRLAAADPAGLLYGAVVSAAALAAVSVHTVEPVRVAIATGGVLVIYWMADLYVHALAVRFDGDARGLLRRLARSAAHKSSVLKGGVPGVVVYVVVYALGGTSSASAYASLGTAIVLLTVAGYLGARHAGAPGREAVIEGAGAGALGVVIVVAKTLLH